MRFRKLAGILAYLLFVAAFVEISLQLFYFAMAGDFLFRRAALPIYANEPYAGYMNRPGLSFDHSTNEFRAHYYVNQAGFRVPRPGTEYSATKPANTYRILLLGPSFAFGWAVDYEKSFAALLPQMLSERRFAAGKTIELIDAGIPAMFPATQLAWYEHQGKNYQPDLVIQFIYASMAVPNAPESNTAVDGSGYLTIKNMTNGQRWRDGAKQSATVFYGWMVWTEFDTWLHPKSAASGSAVLGAGRPLAQMTRFDTSLPQVRDAIAFYDRLHRVMNDSGARLLIVYLPVSYAVHPEDESRWRHLGLKDAEAQRSFDNAFVKYLNDQDIPSVNITEDLRKAATKGKRLYNWLDIHWTPEGNIVAARAVADSMTSVAAQH